MDATTETTYMPGKVVTFSRKVGTFASWILTSFIGFITRTKDLDGAARTEHALTFVDPQFNSTEDVPSYARQDLLLAQLARHLEVGSPELSFLACLRHQVDTLGYRSMADADGNPIIDYASAIFRLMQKQYGMERAGEEAERQLKAEP